jgi:chemotaxis protein methyltransferase CheR
VTETLAIPEAERRDYEAFKARVRRSTGLDLNLYKQQQMHRRLVSLLDRVGVRTFADYYALIDRDPREMGVFLDRLTINVSELFRNPEKWQELREHVLMPLVKEQRPLRVWSAGCSFGAEPFSLAMLLGDLAPACAHYLLATDIDRGILARAREGLFSEADARAVPAEYKARYLNPYNGGYQASTALKSRISFRVHNLLADPFEQNFDLILCRNVVIYFTDAAKDELFARFANALRPGGTLLLGGTERILNPRDIGLDSPRPFFYRRLQPT